MNFAPQIYLVATVEVDKDDRIFCQAEGCGPSVHKHIHVVRDGETIKVVGSECFKHIWV
jgi:hypothetical protein